MKDENLVLPIELVENADSQKPVLNKIMIRRIIQFVAPLKTRRRKSKIQIFEKIAQRLLIFTWSYLIHFFGKLFYYYQCNHRNFIKTHALLSESKYSSATKRYLHVIKKKKVKAIPACYRYLLKKVKLKKAFLPNERLLLFLLDCRNKIFLKI